LLLLSAGFDAADGDEGNIQDGRAGIDLRPEDYAWATHKLRALPGQHGGAPPKVVSVLEGGYGAWDGEAGCYDRSALAACCVAHVKALA
jgi:acetoin utilization deacetylase AcuC-like enzyme